MAAYFMLNDIVLLLRSLNATRIMFDICDKFVVVLILSLIHVLASLWL